MKINTSLSYWFGVTIGLLIAHLSKTPITLNTVLFFGCIAILMMEGKLFDFLRFLFITAHSLYYGAALITGEFKWYYPLIFILLILCLYYSCFTSNKNDTIFVDKGDVTKFSN